MSMQFPIRPGTFSKNTVIDEIEVVTVCPECRYPLTPCSSCSELRCECIGAFVGMLQHWKDGKPRDYQAQKNELLFTHREVKAWSPR